MSESDRFIHMDIFIQTNVKKSGLAGMSVNLFTSAIHMSSDQVSLTGWTRISLYVIGNIKRGNKPV